MQITTNLDELSNGIHDPRILALLRHWQNVRSGRFASIAELDLTAIPATLPLLYVILVPPRRQLRPEQIQYRFVGEEVAKSLGIYATGMTVAEVLTRDAAENFTAAIGGFLKDPCILHSVHVNHLPNVTEIRTERLILPMSGTDGSLDAFAVAFSTLERSPLNRLHEKSENQNVWVETLRKFRL